MKIQFRTAGESHGPGLVAILEGIPAGLAISTEIIDNELQRRQKGTGAGPRMKIEKDHVKILSGVMEGLSTGAPMAFFIENLDHAKWREKPVSAFTTPRPGHADLAGVIKYGYNDLRPSLERASARETAARVAVGAVCKHFINQFDIKVGGYVISIGEIVADLEHIPVEQRFIAAEKSEVRCPDPDSSRKMEERIKKVMHERDTLGGVIEVVALNLPPGLGSFAQWDSRLESRLGAAILSIQAMKGVEIGSAFENSHRKGTEVQDAVYLHEDRDQLVRKTNRSGGLEGGVSTGSPLVIRAAMKPIATTLKSQDTVNLLTGDETKSVYERSDFCPVPRAVPVVEAMVAFVIADALLEKLGGDSIDEIIHRFNDLRQSRLSSVKITGGEHIFWSDMEKLE